MVGSGMPFVFSPRKIRTSVPHIVLAPTLTRTSSGPMSGVSTSITSIWPGRRNTAASILFLLALSVVSLTSCDVLGNIMHQVPHLGISSYILIDVELVFFVSLLIWLNTMARMHHMACCFL